MREKEVEFLNRFKEATAILFLGQSYLAIDLGYDPLLKEIRKKYHSIEVKSPDSYDLLFIDEPRLSPDDIEERLAWVQDRCKRVTTPWLVPVGDYAWNGVWSSALDTIWTTALARPFRDLNKIYSEQIIPQDLRNRTKLNCTHLFGTVASIDPKEIPPLTKFKLPGRRQVAVSLLRRLPEALTPLGTLTIDGYDANTDWLRPEDLFAVLSTLGVGQVHYFSNASFPLQDELLLSLVENGIVVLHEHGLHQVLREGSDGGYISLTPEPRLMSTGRTLFVEKKEVPIPIELWKAVTRTARILVSEVFMPPASISDDLRYFEFRKFLAESSSKPMWEGHARGFAFRRDYEQKLQHEVLKALSSKDYSSRPILLYGRTGTGKSVALSSLAYDIGREKTYPVLYIDRITSRLSHQALDRFCEWAEDAGAKSVLVVWDGMQEYVEYLNLLHHFSSRGRRNIVLVGSVYRDQASVIKGEAQKLARTIEAPDVLSEQEFTQFKEFLSAFEPLLSTYLSQYQKKAEDTFLVALYRLLPQTRVLLRHGLNLEISYAEKSIVDRSQGIEVEQDDSVLALALARAGLDPGRRYLSERLEEFGGEQLTEIQLLTELVMVPGKFGLHLPIEFLFRALDKPYSQKFIDVLTKTDIFSWSSDSLDNVLIGPRHPLEARLLTSRLGGASAEVGIACRLIEAVSPGTNDSSAEIQFGVELVRSMGPNGQDARRYRDYFNSIASSLRRLRSERGVKNVRLMLQEATLWREYASVVREDDVAFQDALSMANEAVECGNEHLDISHENQNSRMRTMLFVERAAALNARSKSCVENLDFESALENHELVLGLSQDAWNFSTANFHVLDVVLVSGMILLEGHELDTSKRAEIIANLFYVLSLTEGESIPISSYERLNGHRIQLGKHLKDEDMQLEAVEALLVQGSCAGVYLHAYILSGENKSDTPIDSTKIAALECAISFLDKFFEYVATDYRCLYLYLRLWWVLTSGQRLFSGERLTVAFDKVAWRKCLSLVHSLQGMEGARENLILQYLRGMAEFHLDETNLAAQTFRELDRMGSEMGRRRIIKSYLASNADGTPRRFSGQVKRTNGQRGDVYVEDLRKEIPFFSNDFGLTDTSPGTTLPNFHIAFNFIGLIADPVGMHESGR